MHQTGKLFYSLTSNITACLLLFISAGCLTIAHAADNKGPVVVTIKPLYSLVTQLTEGIETPALLMKQPQSPHHYNMRPSERRLLSDARVIIWTGPQMEAYLTKILQQQKNTTVIISAMQADKLHLLGKRAKHGHERDHHHSKDLSGAEDHAVDPHIWLSSRNAAAISQHIADRLISHDPKNADLYNKNLHQLITRINQTRDFINTTLEHRAQPYIAFHDAFHYFDDEYRLNYIDAINYDEETGTSLKRLRQVRTKIKKHNIQCLVYQSPKPAIVDSLEKQTSVKAVALDPLGLNINDEKNAWFELMRQLAVNFNQCLKP